MPVTATITDETDEDGARTLVLRDADGAEVVAANLEHHQWWLQPANDEYPAIALTSDEQNTRAVLEFMASLLYPKEAFPVSPSIFAVDPNPAAATICYLCKRRGTRGFSTAVGDQHVCTNETACRNRQAKAGYRPVYPQSGHYITWDGRTPPPPGHCITWDGRIQQIESLKENLRFWERKCDAAVQELENLQRRRADSYWSIISVLEQPEPKPSSQD